MTASNSTPTVSIVIVTWNGKKYALECLESLRALGGGIRIEVVVVDNASTDGTPQAIRESYPEVKLIENEGNWGFAKANNIGIAATSGDYVCLVNSDVVVPPGCLEKMVDYMEANPSVGLLGPKMLGPSGELGQSVNRLPTVWNYLCFALGLHALVPNSKFFGGYLMAGYRYDKTEDVEVLTGWFWMVPRRALDQVGGLDERFFMYGEDLDWSYRFLKAGWRVVFLPRPRPCTTEQPVRGRRQTVSIWKWSEPTCNISKSTMGDWVRSASCLEQESMSWLESRDTALCIALTAISAPPPRSRSAEVFPA